MLSKVTTPANPNGSSWVQSCAIRRKTKRLNSSCSKKDHECIIIESQRIRTIMSAEKPYEYRIADQGRVSKSHNNMVHKPISECSEHSSSKSGNGQLLAHGMLMNAAVHLIGRTQNNL